MPVDRRRPQNPYETTGFSTTQIRRKTFIGSLFGFFISLIRLVMATVVFFGLLIIASYYVFGLFVRGDEVPAPNIVGKPLSVAGAEINKWKLSILVDREEESDAVSPGEIISQDPPVGTVIKKRTPIRVVVSSGAKNQPLPMEIIGMPNEEAGMKLRDLDMEVGNLSQIPSTEHKPGTVIATDPPAGTGVPPQTKVNLLVAAEIKVN